MCTAIDLIQKNKCHNFIIVEKSGGPGGTWRDNKYPGAYIIRAAPRTRDSYWDHQFYRPLSKYAELQFLQVVAATVRRTRHF